jgi:hypothetical protein
MSLPPDAIDYQPIVESAVAALARNTPDARQEVYARVKDIVMHHLRQSGQPEAIVELETLALDLAISKVERRWRAPPAADLPVRKSVPKREARGIAVLDALSHGELSATTAEALQGRPRGAGFESLAAFLRPRAMRIGLAIAVPIAAVLIAVLAANNVWYGGPADRPKSQDRLLAGPEPPVRTHRSRPAPQPPSARPRSAPCAPISAPSLEPRDCLQCSAGTSVVGSSGRLRSNDGLRGYTTCDSAPWRGV